LALPGDKVPVLILDKLLLRWRSRAAVVVGEKAL
jgi:hypothetical protein